MPETCVVHLVRKKNGLAPFAAFVRSYTALPAGADHDLVFIFKGFAARDGLAEYHALLEGLPHKSLFVADRGFDIEPYFTVATQFDYRYFFFLNSFSVLLDREWLAKMRAHITGEQVGVVGATGSYESAYANRVLMLGALPITSWSLLHGTVRYGMRRREQTRFRSRFAPFPNYHLRTNAFLIARSVMLRLQVDAIRSKTDAARFESGENSLTRQILRQGLKPLVIGRDGRAYEKEAWYESGTFRSGDQRNLLVADNRTNHYLQADPDTQRMLAVFAWGDRALDPAPRQLSSRRAALDFVVNHTVRKTLRQLLSR